MNREYSVVQFRDHTKSSKMQRVPSNHDMSTPSLTNVRISTMKKISTTYKLSQDEEHEKTKATPVYSHLFQGRLVTKYYEIYDIFPLLKNYHSIF